MLFLLLTNNEKISIQNDYSYLGNLIHIAENEQEALRICSLCTKQNVKNIKIVDENDSIITSFQNITLRSQPLRMNEADDNDILTGRVIVTFVLGEMSNMEIEIEALKESQEIQDEAIDDLAEVLSELVEG